MTTKNTTRKGRFINTLVMLVTLTVAVILVNILSTFVFGRLDLTENKVNSLSPQTVEVVKEMTEADDATPIVVNVYVSKNLPPRIKVASGMMRAPEIETRGIRQKLLDKLNEYRSHSPDMFEIHVIEEDVEEKAEKEGLELVTGEDASLKEAEGTERKRYAIGCTFHYEGQVEVFSNALDPNTYEYEVTKRLLRLRDRAEQYWKHRRHIQMATDVFDRLKTCHKELEDVIKGEHEESALEEGLLGGSKDEDEEGPKGLESLMKNWGLVARKCDGLPALVNGRAAKLIGQNYRYDEFMNGPDDGGGGVVTYADVYQNLNSVLAGEQKQQMNMKQAMMVRDSWGLMQKLRQEVEGLHETLKQSPGEKKIGFVYGHGEFCPFIPDKMPLQVPEMPMAMGPNPMGQIDQFQRQLANDLQRSARAIFFPDQDFKLEAVGLDKPVSEDYSAILVYGARKAFTDEELYELDQYVMRGGTLVVMLNHWDVTLAGLSEGAEQSEDLNEVLNDVYEIKATESNIDEILEAYGLVVNRDLVADPTSAKKVSITFLKKQIGMDLFSGRRAVMKVREGPEEFRYPLFVDAQEFAADNVLVSGLKSFAMPYASTLEFEGPPGGELTAASLVKTSPNAVRFPDPLNIEGDDGNAEKLDLHPQTLMSYVKQFSGDGSQTLAMLVEGTFPSAFSGKSLDFAPKTEGGYDRLDSGEGGRVLVFGSTLAMPELSLHWFLEDVPMLDMNNMDPKNMGLMGQIVQAQVRNKNMAFVEKAQQQYVVLTEDTQPFLASVLDWAAQRAALTQIRAKLETRRPLEVTSETKRKTYAWFAIGGLPLLFLLFGVGYRQIRVMRRRSLAQKWTEGARPDSPPETDATPSA